jgi:hypothetical protein
MADALSYRAEPVKPKQAAMDAAMAYKAAKEAKEAAATQTASSSASSSPPQNAPAVAAGRPKKERIQFDIVSAQVEMTDQLTDVVNWAYRGKSGQQVRVCSPYLALPAPAPHCGCGGLRWRAQHGWW